MGSQFRRTTKRKDQDEKEFLNGKIRSLEKKIRELERENARLAKILVQNDLMTGNVPEGKKTNKPKKKNVLFCEECKSEDVSVVEFKALDGKRVYLKCKECGTKKRVTRDE